MKKQFQEEKTCACCGKTMYVLHPSRWAYKKKKGKETYTWYCSWKCMRKDETVEKRLTQENYDKAVELAIRGEDYLEYLKKCGAKNPSATWCYIKKKLATSDPDKLAKVPEKVGTVINEKGQAVPVVRPLKKEEHKKIEKQQKPILAEVVEKVPGTEAVVMTRKEHEKAHRPIKTIKIIDWEGKEVKNKLEITELKSKVLPNFRYKKVKNDDKDFMVLNGYGFTNEESVIPLGREGWSQLIDEIRTALEQMNI